MRFYPRQKLMHAEGLGQVVVGANFQAHHFIDLFVARCQHQDRHVRHRGIRRFGPHRAAQLEAVQPGQHQVQHHQLRRVAANHVQRLQAVCGQAHLMSSTTQVVAQGLKERLLIFDHQDLRHLCNPT